MVMETETYTPKFKIGHTVITNGGDMAIIVATHLFLRQFTTTLSNHSDYDSRDAAHTLYSIFSMEDGSFCWRWENFLTAYCTNDLRGKRVLNEPSVIKEFRSSYSINDENWLKYSQYIKV